MGFRQRRCCRAIWLSRQAGPKGFEKVVVVKRMLDAGRSLEKEDREESDRREARAGTDANQFKPGAATVTDAPPDEITVQLVTGGRLAFTGEAVQLTVADPIPTVASGLYGACWVPGVTTFVNAAVLSPTELVATIENV